MLCLCNRFKQTIEDAVSCDIIGNLYEFIGHLKSSFKIYVYVIIVSVTRIQLIINCFTRYEIISVYRDDFKCFPQFHTPHCTTLLWHSIISASEQNPLVSYNIKNLSRMVNGLMMLNLHFSIIMSLCS
jgi:hypothetical protein